MTIFTADDGVSTNTTSKTRRWLLNGTSIGTGATVTPSAAGSLVLEVTATGPGGSTVATSAAVTVSAAGGGVTAPTNSAAPVASGTGTVGQTLSVTNGTWTNSPTSYTYQWKRGGAAISGATSSTYALVSADAGTTATCSVTATNSAGSASATSNGISVAAAAASLPGQADLVADWNDTGISAASGASVTSWTDSIGGRTATLAGGSGTAPTVQTPAQVGGKRALRFGGNGAFGVTNMAGSALETATSSGNYTILVVVANCNNTGGQQAPVSSFGGSGQFRVCAGGGILTADANGDPTQAVDFVQPTAMTCLAWSAANDTTNCEVSVNGTRPGCSAATQSFGGNFGIGGYTGGFQYWTGDVVRVLVWKRKLTDYEIWQAEAALRDYYSQTRPWLAYAKPCMFAVGDSLTAGYLGTARGAPPYKLAQKLGIPYGCWGARGHVGAGIADITADISAHAIDSIAALWGGSPFMVAWEWFNDAKGGQTAAQLATPRTTFLANRKAAGWRNVWGTSIDFGPGTPQTSTQQMRADYNAYYVGGGDADKITYLAKLHLNANVGVAGAAPTSGGNTYFNADHIHLTGVNDASAAGYTEVANVFYSVMSGAYA